MKNGNKSIYLDIYRDGKHTYLANSQSYTSFVYQKFLVTLLQRKKKQA